MDKESPKKLSESFLANYKEFCTKFDKLVEDECFTRGVEMEQVVREFLNKWEYYMDQFFPYSQNVKFKPNSDDNNCDAILDEDCRLIGQHCQEDELAGGKPSLLEWREKLQASDNHLKILSDVYRRACEAVYLRITFNKSRRKQEDNRLEAVVYGRQAIRYDPDSFYACYWYMIALGWYLNAMTGHREKTVHGHVFKLSAERCVKLNPQDPLGHNLLGRYYFNVANLSWLERTLAKKFYNISLEGTYRDSEREFRRAHELRDDWMPTGLWMAKVLLVQGRPLREVTKWIDFGLSFENILEPTSELERDELLELRSKLKLSN